MALDSSGNVYVAWGQLPTSGGNANIFFSRGVVTPFSFGISPTRVTGGPGGTVTGTVKLISPAPAGGAVISLSSDSAAASVPASVTVPEGATSATFSINTGPVSSNTNARITASYNGTNTAGLTVEPLFTFAVSDPIGGTPTGFDVFLNEPAPSGGLVIALSSSDPSILNMPASVTVPAGSRFGVFSMTTTPVSTPTSVQITGTANGFTQTASVTVRPPVLVFLSLSPSTATGGASSTGTVALFGPAPAAGTVISLSSSDPSASVPASVTIPAGSTSASFTITTNPGSSTTNVTISASYNGGTRSASLAVQPLILEQLTVQPSTIGGGGSASMIICMNASVPSDMVVSMSSSNPSLASPPASVTILQGTACRNFSPIINTNPVSVNTNVTISASFNGVTLTRTLTLQPITLEAVQVENLPNGNTGFVNLNGPAPAGGITISLSSSNPSVLSVPASVFVPAGANNGQFAVTTSPVSAQTTVTVTASYNGVMVSSQFPVFPPQ